MPFAHRPDARIWWDQSGTGDPVLLIMGHAYGADMWHRTAPGLAASYRVIRFDNRGAGRSSDPVGAENRVTLFDLGVLVVEVGEPVAPQNAPAIADTRVHPRYTAGISEAQRPGPFRRSGLFT